MIRERIAAKIEASIAEARRAGEIPEFEARAPEIADTKSPEHGDYASNIALVAAKEAGMPPRQLADVLAAHLAQDPDLAKVEVAGPGFLNLTLAPSALSVLVPEVLDRGEAFARTPSPRPLRINVEFVSVNPNGPITIGSGRGAAFGDTLCRVLEAAGNTVHREYYINDGVNSEQMRLFAESVRHYVLLAAGLPSEMPADGYKGDYVEAVACAATERVDLWASHLPPELAERARSDGLLALGPDLARVGVAAFQAVAQSLMLARQREDLAAFGVEFDTWFSEQSLHDSGAVAECLARLAERAMADEEPYRTELKLGKEGEVVETVRHNEEPGALWLRSTKFGDDQDRVLRRSDGRLTYIASDVAYHHDKFSRPVGADKLITVLGPDHHGYVGRLAAVVQALGYRRDQLEVVIFQLVRFLKDGQPAPMRKRDGNVYALIDLIEEIGAQVAPSGNPEERRRAGADVARFFYSMRSHDTVIDFDIDLATRQSDENPLFYAQYAHARICSVLRRAATEGLPGAGPDWARLEHPRELALIKKVADLPHEVRRCAEDYGVHRLATYALEVARAFHHFYDACRVILPEDAALYAARFALCEAAAVCLRATFALLGVSAPEKMERATED